MQAHTRARRGVTLMISVVVVSTLAVTLPAGAQQALPCDFQSDGDYSGSYAKVSEPGPYAIAPQEIVEIESELDGVTIQMGVVRPEVPDGVRVPVIVDASPYYHPLQTMDLRACRPFLTENFVSHGYAVVLLAIRGTGDAGGCMNLMGPGERADIDQAITWLGEQEWSNGSVGMIGLSYDGATQWEAASFGNPHLKTIVPVSGVPDLFELMYGNGNIDWRAPAILSGIYYAESAGFYAPGRSPEHTVEVTACPEYGVGTAASLYSAATGEVDPLGYYAERRYRDEIVENYRGSIYLVQGLQDWNVNPGQQFPWIYELEDRGVYVKYLLGQWGHSYPYGGGNRMDWANILLTWFDRWLKGAGTDIGPPVEVQDDTGQWRRAPRWPGGEEVELFLNPEGELGSASSGEGSTVTIGPDPFHLQSGYSTDSPIENQACIEGTCASFQTEPFAEDFRLAGLTRADLTVIPQGPGGQLAVYLYAVSGDGAAERVGWGQLDLRFRDGSDVASPVTPGEPLEVGFDLQPLDSVIPAGSSLYVTISAGTGWNRLPNLPNYPMELAVGDGGGSLRLASPKVPPGSFFEPKEP